ncbi:hypothetical protein A2U01_0044534, partial [Trifolium medium]|nr:hypothetical protein [Trifolium medium]
MFLRLRSSTALNYMKAVQQTISVPSISHFPKTLLLLPLQFYGSTSTSSRASDLEFFSYSEGESNHHR